MASHIFREETGLYLMFSEQILQEFSEDLGLTRKQMKAYIWIYYFNKFIAKRPYISSQNTSQFFHAIDEDLPVSIPAIDRILLKMFEAGYLTKEGDQYRLDNTASRSFIDKLSHIFEVKLKLFEEYSKSPSIKHYRKPIGRRKKMGRHKKRGKKRNKSTGRPVGRPYKVIKRYTKKNNPWIEREKQLANEKEKEQVS